jgi:OFA family oxalate/formate antiporter-like MFS transporter
LSVGAAAVLGSVTAFANAAGRLGFSAWADTFKDRNTIYKLIFILSIALTAATIFTHGIENKIVVLCIALLIIVNAGYGGGFSNVPTLLSDHFGMKSISAVHGMCLSAWAIAGLTGNQMATYIVDHTGAIDPETNYNPVGTQNVLYATCALYIVALIVCFVLVKAPKKEEAKA